MKDDPSRCMWYCPDCQKWVGSKLDSCPCGAEKPRYPLLNKYDVNKPSYRVTTADRLRAKARRIINR